MTAKNKPTSKAAQAEKIESPSFDQVATGVSQVSMGVITCLAALIGAWGLVCLFSALNSGGLLEAMKDYLAAIGM